MLSMFWATFWAVVAAEAAVGFIVVVGMLILLSLLQYVTRSRTDESRDESLCELWGEVFDLQKEDDKLRRQNKERDEEMQTVWNIIESLRQQTQENTKRLEQLSKDAVVQVD